MYPTGSKLVALSSRGSNSLAWPDRFFFYIWKGRKAVKPCKLNLTAHKGLVDRMVQLDVLKQLNQTRWKDLWTLLAMAFPN